MHTISSHVDRNLVAQRWVNESSIARYRPVSGPVHRDCEPDFRNNRATRNANLLTGLDLEDALVRVSAGYYLQSIVQE